MIRKVLACMIRKVLAWFIKPGKEPTKENILKYALKNYLNGAKVHGFRGNGLCHYLSDSLMHYLDVRAIYCSEMKHYIPLYDINYAIKHFNAKNGQFWWDIKDWWHRYKFMKWLIKQYKE